MTGSFDASIDQGCLMSHQPMIWHDIMELLLTCQCVLNSKFEHLGIFRQAAVRPQPTTIENKEVIFLFSTDSHACREKAIELDQITFLKTSRPTRYLNIWTTSLASWLFSISLRPKPSILHVFEGHPPSRIIPNM